MENCFRFQGEAHRLKMRLYHLLPSIHALGNARRRRLKLAEIHELNDPFELWCSSQEDRSTRRAFRRWRNEMARRYGMICFSKGWSNPVLWSHYADRHRGMCLGFDVKDECIEPIKYVERRTPLKLPMTMETMKPLLHTKFSGWNYEEEWRCWCRLEERDQATGLYFRSFDDDIALRELILGPLCAEPRDNVIAALKRYGDHVAVTKSRLAFQAFKVIEDKRGF